MEDMREVLTTLYSRIYVDFVVRNTLEPRDPEQITNELFHLNLQKYMRTVPGFDARLT